MKTVELKDLSSAELNEKLTLAVASNNGELVSAKQNRRCRTLRYDRRLSYGDFSHSSIPLS